MLGCLACAVVPYCYCTATTRRLMEKLARLHPLPPFSRYSQEGTAHLGAETKRKNIKLIWNLFLTLTDIGMHHYYLYHIIPSAQVFQGQQWILQSDYLLILHRTGKWSAWKAFSVFHLNFTCGKLFLFMQKATTLMFSYWIHRATARAQPKQDQKQSKLKQTHLCRVLFLCLLWAEGPHMMDSYQPLESKSVSFKEHLYFVNQLNHMNSTSMNSVLFNSN